LWSSEYLLYQGVHGRWTNDDIRFATAYAVTKALLPLRLILSVWGTPWFARFTTVPVFGRVRRSFSRKKMTTATAGTGATGGGVLPKEKPLTPP